MFVHPLLQNILIKQAFRVTVAEVGLKTCANKVHQFQGIWGILLQVMETREAILHQEDHRMEKDKELKNKLDNQ